MRNASGSYLIPSTYTPPVSSLPTVTTMTPYGIGNDYIYTGGNVVDDGELQILDRGVCYSTSTGPTISDPSISKGINAGSFLSDLLNLNTNTTYYIRAYALNSLGISYGNEVIGTTQNLTLYTPPIVITKNSNNITAWNFNIIGEVSSNGGSTITDRGFYVSNSSDASISGTQYSIGGYKVEEYSELITKFSTNVLENTIYYYQAYATNGEGTGFGEVKSLNTLSYIDLSINTIVPSNITGWEFESGIDILASGYPLNTIYSSELEDTANNYYYTCGICYSESSNPTINDASISFIPSNGSYIINTYPLLASGINNNTTYYIRSFAYREIDGNILYGNEVSATIPLLTLPTVETLDNDGINNLSILMEGNIINPDNYNLTEVGFVYATHNNPTMSDFIYNGILETNDYYSSIVDVQNSGVTYYYRAYLKYDFLGPSYTEYGSIKSVITGGSNGFMYTNIDGFDKHILDSSASVLFEAADESVYIISGIRYYPNSVIPEDKTITTTVMANPSVVNKTFSTYPNIANVYSRLMSTSPYRSIYPNTSLNEFFYIPVDVSFNTSGKHVMGIIADNFYKIKINGELFVQSDTTINTVTLQGHSFFKYLNLFEINAYAGTNTIELGGINIGGPGVIGMIIWDETFTIDEIISNDPPVRSDWTNHILFSSEELVNLTMSIGTCPIGYHYDPTFINDNNGPCVKIDYSTPFIKDNNPSTKTILVKTYLTLANGETVSSMSINYGDGNTDNFTTMKGLVKHTYASPSSGSYTITISITTNLTIYSRQHTISMQ